MSTIFNLTRINGAAPKALILNKMTTKIGLPAVVVHTGHDRFRS
jgi:hypothetical protein